MADKKSKFISGQKETPDLEIQRTPEGKFIINYAASDPMGLMSPMAGKDLDSVIQSFFGYSGWDEYKRENKKDLTRKVDSETGAAPTVHPFHVAYAFLEFFNNFKAEDYVVVGYPIKPTVQELEPDFEGPIQSEEEYEEDEERKAKESEEQARTDARVKSKSEKTTLATSAEQAQKDAEDRGIKRGRGPIKLDEITGAGGASEEAALTGLEVTAGQAGPADEEEARSLTKLQRQVKKKAADEMELLKAKKKIESIINKRRAFFGTSVVADLGDPQRGVFNNALYSPAEKLENTDAIDRVKQRFNFAAKYQALLMQEFPVQHPNGLYWKNMPKNIDDIVGEPGNALILSFGQDKIKQSVLLREFNELPIWEIAGALVGQWVVGGAIKKAAAWVAQRAAAKALAAGATKAAAAAAGEAAIAGFFPWALGALKIIAYTGGYLTIAYVVGKLIAMWLDSRPTPLMDFEDKFSGLPDSERPIIFRSKQERDKWLEAEGRRIGPDGPTDLDVDLGDLNVNISDVYNEASWEENVENKKIELKRKALDRKVKRIEQGAQTPEERETEPADRAGKGYLRGDITLIYELLPKGWRDGKWLTDAEDVLARRVAANRNVTPEVVFDSERRTLEEIPPILNTYVPGDGLDPNVADQLERITKGKRYAIEQKEKASYILRSNKARMPSWFEEYYKAVNETHPYFVENYDPPEALGRWATPDNPYSPTELYKLWKTQNHPAVFLINELRAQKIIDDEVWKEARIALVGKAVGAGWEDASSILEDAGVNPQSEEYMKAREASRTEARITPATDAIEAWRAGTENAYGGIDWPGPDTSPPMKEGWSDGVEAWEDKDAETWWSEDHDKLKKFEDPTFQQRRLKIKEMEERYEEASASENPSDEQQEVIDSLHAQQRKLKVARGGVENKDGQIVAPPGGYTEWKKMGAYARTEYLQTLGIPVPENVGRFSTSETEEMDLETMDTGPRDEEPSVLNLEPMDTGPRDEELDEEPSVLNLEPMDTGPRDEEEAADLDLAKPDAPGAGDYKKSRAERAKAAMARSRVGAREKEVQEFPDAGAIGTPEEEGAADVRELPDYGRIGTPEEEDAAAASQTGVPVPYAFIQDNLGIDKRTWDMYRNTIGKIESNNKYAVKGGAGDLYDGRYQIGGPAKGSAWRIGLKDPGHEPEQRQMFRDNPELQEKIFASLTVGNHKKLMGAEKYKAADMGERLAILGYAHNQGGGGASKWLRTGVVGKDKFGTKGTKYYDAIKAALGGGVPASVAKSKVPLKEIKALIFGHSQTGRYGKVLQKRIESAGGTLPAGLRVHSARADGEVKTSRKLTPGLSDYIKEVKAEDGPFTHAYLFLGGNTYVPGMSDGKVINQKKYDRYVADSPRSKFPDHAVAKKEIIDYVVNVLKVPKENILVILPPINNDNAYSKSRRLINNKATSFLNTMGINVHPPVVGGADDFAKDGIHISGNGPLAQGASSNILGHFSSETGERRRPSSLAQKLSKNRRLAAKLDWKPEDFGATRFDVDLIKKIKAFQEESGLRGIDGVAGPSTIAALRPDVAAPDTAVEPDPDVAAVEDDNQRLENLEAALERARVELNKAGNTPGRQAQLTKQIKDYEQAISDATKAPEPAGDEAQIATAEPEAPVETKDEDKAGLVSELAKDFAKYEPSKKDPGKKARKKAPGQSARTQRELSEDEVTELVDKAQELKKDPKKYVTQVFRFRQQFGDIFKTPQLMKMIEEADNKGLDPEAYVADRVKFVEEDKGVAADSTLALVKAKPPAGIKILDPRKGYVASYIEPFINSLSNVNDGKWIIGDMSLPLGGGKEDQKQIYKDLPMYKNIRFNHSTHTDGTDIDFSLPLKNGGFNGWDEVVSPRQVDVEKILDLIRHASQYTGSRGWEFHLAKNHVNYILNNAKDKQEAKKLFRRYRSIGGHYDHLHINFRGAYARKRNLDDMRRQVAKGNIPTRPGEWATDPQVAGLEENISESKILTNLFKVMEEINDELV
jgi:hypothetical protein